MIYKNKKIYLLLLIFVLSVLFIGNSCLAGFLNTTTKNNIKAQTDNASASSYNAADANTIYSLVQTVINAFLALIGVILLAYLLSAGYKWMTAHGEEEKVNQAKDTIKRAIVGTIIVVGAYAISIFVMTRLEAGTLKDGSPTTNQTTQKGS